MKGSTSATGSVTILWWPNFISTAQKLLPAKTITPTVPLLKLFTKLLVLRGQFLDSRGQTLDLLTQVRDYLKHLSVGGCIHAPACIGFSVRLTKHVRAFYGAAVTSTGSLQAAYSFPIF